ncbi:hypothetical protein LC087_16755 [Bacillus carboniphilus]|uniref:DUF4399 domain-containing protein n=1 Tax=Bacillus carboniphilus TaxID=86663 RepID=A0ABY9JSG3_9BACI|nr:hypothetical protein [Bacillus carboniphilus]WLR42339.1 hypothetical protein LC087_16755 [Bacillus carboniphilus]
MPYCVSLKEPLDIPVGESRQAQICAFEVDEPERPAQVLVSIGDQSQLDDFKLTFADGTPIIFNEVGVYIFPEVIFNTCANLIVTFLKPGSYEFTVSLQEQGTNITLDQEVTITSVY